MASTTLSVTWATWVSQSAPTAVYFNKTGYVLINGASSHYKFGYLYFTNPFPKQGANVTKATLTLRTRALTGSGTVNLTADLATSYPVSISRMNWNTRASGRNQKVSVTKSGPLGDNAVWTFDVTSQMQQVADGLGFQGFLIQSSGGRDMYVQGNMSAALNPTLSVTYTEAPLAPEDLAPHTGAAIGTATPVLTWTYMDHVSGEPLAAAQVQTATAEDGFGAPTWDSGTVALTECELDLSSGYTPAAADTAVWWRVRCQDASGLWSAWADPVSFQYHALPVVSLSQPTGDTFADPTPPIEWAVTGDMPQVRWRASVSALQGSAWKVVAASGDTISTETSWTPTAGLAKAGHIKIIVDVFDGRAREAVPGFPVYGSVVGEFDFAPTATVEPAAALTVTPDPIIPPVVLAWTRSQTPDEWHIYRDGEVLTVHDGLDFSAGGTAYAATDAVCPGGPHVWDIYAVVNGKSSLTTEVATTIERPGTWLIDKDTGERVWLQNEQSHDMTMPEDTSTFTPLGSPTGVVVTTAQRGYEGTMSGELVDEPWLPDAESAALWRQRLLKWKADPGHDLWMLTEELGFPVNISEVTMAGVHPWVGQRWTVSFKFHQTGNYLFKVIS